MLLLLLVLPETVCLRRLLLSRWFHCKVPPIWLCLLLLWLIFVFLVAPTIILLILNLTKGQVTSPSLSSIILVNLHHRLIATVEEALLVKGHRKIYSLGWRLLLCSLLISLPPNNFLFFFLLLTFFLIV